MLFDEGKDVKQILAEMILHMRSVMIYKAVGLMLKASYIVMMKKFLLFMQVVFLTRR